jgi:hypothetical protein
MVEVRIGDVVTTDTTLFGSPITYRLTIKTQDAANYATELVNKPNAAFKLERSAQETPVARKCLKCEKPLPAHWSFSICNTCPQG